MGPHSRMCPNMILYILLSLPLLYILKRVFFNKKKQGPLGPDPMCTITTGKIQGRLCYSKSGRVFSSFSGIPYAKAPVGPLRFLRPQPIDKWEGVKKCTRSVEFINRNVFLPGNPLRGQEDGLVVNVNTPDLKSQKLLPVMVFIHGGGFVSGSGTRALYGAEYFMDKDIVMVSINYRLSVLGGLYLDGKLVPGNQGMRDQVLALQWVQENIQNFGGDKERVTIFGESAGGMSVMNHYLSPMSSGLFSAAIAMSGSPISPFVGLDKHPKHYGFKLAEHLGCNPKDPIEKILETLQSIKAEDFQNLGYMFEEFLRAPMPFKPIVDGDLVDDPILPEEPLTLLEKGEFNKVPVMIGTNQNEGLLMKGFYNRTNKYDEAFDNWDSLGPLTFFHREKDEYTEEESTLVQEYTKKHFGNFRFSAEGEAADTLVEMYGDILFAAPADIAAKMITTHKDAPPLYHYMYNHQGPLSLYDILSLPPWRMFIKMTSLIFGFDLFKSSDGVCHGDELFMMFKAHALPTSFLKSDDDKRVSEDLINMWTDFATHHNPTPKDNTWTQFDPKDPKYLEIGSKLNTMKYPEGHRKRMEELKDIWEKIPPTMRYKESKTWKKDE